MGVQCGRTQEGPQGFQTSEVAFVYLFCFHLELSQQDANTKCNPCKHSWAVGHNSCHSIEMSPWKLFLEVPPFIPISFCSKYED